MVRRVERPHKAAEGREAGLDQILDVGPAASVAAGQGPHVGRLGQDQALVGVGHYSPMTTWIARITTTATTTIVSTC